jgi:hypothetical protein
MGQWGVVAKATAAGIGYSYYPSIWEDSGKIYCKAQGEYDVNIFNTVTNTWSSILLPSSGDMIPMMGTADPCRSELIWVANNKLYMMAQYMFHSGTYEVVNCSSFNLTTGAMISFNIQGQYLANMPLLGANWGRTRHKTVIKDPESGRIFLINYYMKQIVEFTPATETFAIVKTWTETLGGQANADAAGCDAVCLNGKIYLLGKHLYQAGVNGGVAGPVEVTIADWSTVTKAVYPDYAHIDASTYHFYCDTAWMAIGNYIYGYGGRMQGGDAAQGGGGFARGDILRKIMFNPSANTWTDLGVTSSALLYASAASYSGKAYMIAGYEAGAASQANRSFEYILEAPTAFTATYNAVARQVELAWTDNCAEEAYYIVARKRDDEAVYTQIANLPPNTLTYNDTTIDIAVHWYSYKVWCEKVL